MGDDTGRSGQAVFGILKQFPLESPWLEPAKQLIENYFDLLAKREYAQLTRRLKISEEELKLIIQLIQSLNPRPGSQITASQPEYIIPDVIVSKNNSQWKVELNPDAAPRLRVNPHYASLIKQVNNNVDNTCLKNHLQEARWFIKSLVSRNETLLKVATSIVERQTDFLEHGDEAMKALVLHDIPKPLECTNPPSRELPVKNICIPRAVFLN